MGTYAVEHLLVASLAVYQAFMQPSAGLDRSEISDEVISLLG